MVRQIGLALSWKAEVSIRTPYPGLQKHTVLLVLPTPSHPLTPYYITNGVGYLN